MCDVCGTDCSERYMVTPAVWEAGGVGTGYAHLRCLEERIGRRLRRADFDETLPINAALLFGYEMGWREAQEEIV